LKKQKKNRIVFIVFGFSKKNLRSQPWFSVNELLKQFVSNYDVNLITESDDIYSNKYKIIKLKKLFNFFSPTIDLMEKIDELKPIKIFIIIGSHELLLFTRFNKFRNLNFIIGNNRFKLKELVRLNFKDLFTEIKLLKIPFFSSLLPGFLIKLGFSQIKNSKIIYLSKEAQKRYRNIGLLKGKVFITKKKIFSKKDKIFNSKNKKIILTYFGPPLNLRGIDLVINTFNFLSKRKNNIFLNLFIRNNNEIYLKNKMLDLIQLINNSKFKDKINLDTKYYLHKTLQKKIKQSSIIILPFKITISDTPLVIFDAIKTKVPLFTLDTPGVTEYVKKTNSFICKDQKDLFYKISKFVGIN